MKRSWTFKQLWTAYRAIYSPFNCQEKIWKWMCLSWIQQQFFECIFSQNFTYSVFGNIASNSEIIEYYFNDNYYRNKITNNKPYIVACVFNKEAMRFTYEIYINALIMFYCHKEDGRLWVISENFPLYWSTQDHSYNFS